MSTFNVTVDWDLCESYGVCIAAAPKIFDLNDEDDLLLLEENPAMDQLNAVRDAMARCPKRAIGIVESV